MLTSLRTSFFTIFFIFLSIFIFSKIFGPLPFSVNSITTTKSNLFTVSGTGEATAVPDTAMINLGVSKEASTVTAAQNQVNEIINKITDDLKKLGVKEEDIKTTNYSVNPNYDYTLGKRTPNGYTVNASIEIKIKPIEKANQAIDIATADGANQVGGVNFVLNDSEQKELENEARIEAVKKAKEKAKSLANAAGIKLGKVIDVQENASGYPRPIFQTATLEKTEDQSAPTELNPGENKVSITVTLSYETH